MRISDWSSDVCSSDLHSNREIVAGGNGGAKAVNDTHIMVRRGIVLMWIATALVFGLNIVAAVMQDRFLIGVGLAVTALYALAGIALGVFANVMRGKRGAQRDR